MKNAKGRLSSVFGKLTVMAFLMVLVGLQLGCSMTGAKQVEQEPVAPYHGPKIGIAVGSFENLTGIEQEEYTTGTTIQTGAANDDAVRNTSVRDPFGFGMRNQLITALTQTGVFAVSLDEGKVNFRIEGAITEYEPSQASIAGGYGWGEETEVASDPTVSSGYNFVQVLTENAAAAFGKQDHIAMNVHLVDLDTSMIVASSAFEASPKDLGAALTLVPGLSSESDLIDTGAQVQTPMQKAVRACLTMAAAWASNQLREQRVASK